MVSQKNATKYLCKALTLSLRKLEKNGLTFSMLGKGTVNLVITFNVGFINYKKVICVFDSGAALHTQAY
jgi:hypothetical protein